MPRRNLFWLTLIAFISLVCYHRMPGNRFGRVLANAMDHVGRNYYQPVDDFQLFEGAMKGIMGRLDENSAYISASKKQLFEEGISKQFGGVGFLVELDPKTKQLTVANPLPGKPAALAGILRGDKILKIDGHSTQGMSQNDAIERMRGLPKTSVTLTVLHPGQSQPADVTIVREVIQIDTVEGDSRTPSDKAWNFWLPDRDRIGYVRITGFAESERADDSGQRTTTTGDDLKKALETLTEGKLRGMVLDLRDNPGGSLKAAVEVCNLLIDSGEIVTTRGRDGRVRRAFQASGNSHFTGFPLAVLINQNSASASEIVAACLQDHQRAVVVGQQSYGKGTVQEVTDMGESLGTLKLTVATYWRPSGRNIHRAKDDAKGAAWGVVPDEGFRVVVDDEEHARYHHWLEDRDSGRPPADRLGPAGGKEFVDRPLVKALEYVDKTP